MSATVFGEPRYALVDDSTATGMKLANLRYSYSSEEAMGEDHTGSDFAFAIFNDQTEVTADGIVAVKTAGLGLTIANTITLANESADTLALNSSGLFTTSDAGAGTVLTQLEVGRTNRGFETGSLTAKYKPLVDVSSPTVIT